MKTALAIVALVCVPAACRTNSPQPSGKPASAESPSLPDSTDNKPPADDTPQEDTQDSTRDVSAAVEASMDEFLAYAESVLEIMRKYGNDCDLAAKHLASRAPVFLELGPRMMQVKEALQSLPERERERIKRQSEQSMEAFKARNPDAEEIDRIAKECERTSPAFAEIAPKVMFVKKK